MISVLCANPSSAESSHDQFISIQLFIRSFFPSFIHSFIHSSPLQFIHLLLPSFPYFMHLLIHLINIIIQSFFHSIGLVTQLSISVCKCDHTGDTKRRKQKTQKAIVVFFLESLT